MCTGTSGPPGSELPGFRPFIPNFQPKPEYCHLFHFAAIFLWPPGHECLSVLPCLSIVLLAGGSSRVRTKRSAFRPADPPPSLVSGDESDPETSASRHAAIDEQRKKKKAVQVTICSMYKTEFSEWRRTNFFDQPHDLSIDSCFW